MTIWIPDNDDIDRVISAAKKLMLSFPDDLGDDDEVDFNIPGIVVEELREALLQLEE